MFSPNKDVDKAQLQLLCFWYEIKYAIIIIRDIMIKPDLRRAVMY